MSSAHTSGESVCLRNAEVQVYIAYAWRYWTGRKLLVDDVILRLRYGPAVSTRRMQIKSACPFRNSAKRILQDWWRAGARLFNFGAAIKRLYVGDDGSRLARRYQQNHQKAGAVPTVGRRQSQS